MPKKISTGQVISDKMNKTVVVAVTRLTQHPIYKKTIKEISRFKAHDEKDECKKGDTVSIIESRPLSKDKRWKVLEIVRRGSE
jgi:small subunit ribosomal protein S17